MSFSFVKFKTNNVFNFLWLVTQFVYANNEIIKKNMSIYLYNRINFQT